MIYTRRIHIYIYILGTSRRTAFVRPPCTNDRPDFFFFCSVHPVVVGSVDGRDKSINLRPKTRMRDGHGFVVHATVACEWARPRGSKGLYYYGADWFYFRFFTSSVSTPPPRYTPSNEITNTVITSTAPPQSLLFVIYKYVIIPRCKRLVANISYTRPLCFCFLALRFNLNCFHYALIKT